MQSESVFGINGLSHGSKKLFYKLLYACLLHLHWKSFRGQEMKEATCSPEILWVTSLHELYSSCPSRKGSYPLRPFPWKEEPSHTELGAPTPHCTRVPLSCVMFSGALCSSDVHSGTFAATLWDVLMAPEELNAGSLSLPSLRWEGQKGWSAT